MNGFMDRLKQTQPAEAGEPDVGEDAVRLEAWEQLQRFLAGARHLRFIAMVGQEGLGGARQGVFVVDDQHGRAAHARLRTGGGVAAGGAAAAGAGSPPATGSTMRTVVPRRTALTICNRPPASST